MKLLATLRRGSGEGHPGVERHAAPVGAAVPVELPAQGQVGWPLSVGLEEARQEHSHDPKQQLESHVCSQGGGALRGAWTCVPARKGAQSRPRGCDGPARPQPCPLTCQGRAGQPGPAASTARLASRQGQGSWAALRSGPSSLPFSLSLFLSLPLIFHKQTAQE